METTTLKISMEVKDFLTYASSKTGKSLINLANEAVREHSERFSKPIDIKKLPIQNPAIYPTVKMHISIGLEERDYIKTVQTLIPGRLTETADRIFIMYQNNHKELKTPDHIKVKWLDKKYINWKSILP